MRTLIFGGTGMLGHKLVQVLGKSLEVWTTIRGGFSEVERFQIFDRDRTVEGVDVTDNEALERVINDVKPAVVVNAIGVIKQVPDSNDVIRNLTLNAIFPQRLGLLSTKHGFRLITISTDCVFDGKKGTYSEDDIPDAQDLYGMSKLLGEVAGGNALTIRTSMIGRELRTNHSLVEWFLGCRGGTVRGYVNAIYSGFPTIVLAEIIGDIIDRHRELRGLYHVSSAPINKFDLLTLINKRYDAGIKIELFKDVYIDRSLDSSKFRAATGFKPAGWKEMIDDMAADPTPYAAWHGK